MPLRLLAPALVALLALPAPLRAEMQLLMFEQPGCHWCARWHEEVGDAYPVTPEGRAAPLRPLQLRDPLPEDLTLTAPRPRLTPTFVLTRDGIEVGRLEGYPGEDFFWGLIGRMIADAERSQAGGDAVDG